MTDDDDDEPTTWRGVGCAIGAWLMALLALLVVAYWHTFERLFR
jgi:hypothetical protein